MTRWAPVRMLVVGLLAASLLGCDAGAPAARAADLVPGPPTTLPGQYSAVDGIAELSNGALLVPDPRERSLWFVPPAGPPTAVSRAGPGWNEYSLPERAFSCGDSGLVYDAGQRKLLVVGAAGEVRAATRLAEGFRGSQVKGVDAGCRIYLEGPGGGPGQPDSAPLVVWNGSGGDTATVARVRATTYATYQVSQQAGGRQSTMRMLLPEPFSNGDEWAAVGAGTILVLQNGPFRVFRVVPHQRPVLLPTGVKLPQVPVTEADRRALTPEGVSIHWTVPETKPPLVDGSLHVSRGGRIAVQLHVAAGAGPRVLLLDSTGTRLRVVALTAGEKVVGVGTTRLYTTLPDADGLLVVRRYDLPE